jgi:hypothetical protein
MMTTQVSASCRIVPSIYHGETVVCIASGPSLTREDVEFCRGKARVLVVNTTLLLAPWADAFHAADHRVFAWHEVEVRRFQGLKFSLEGNTSKYGAIALKDGGIRGLSKDPGVICNGRNSGFQAINISTLLGATRIVLLGYDMQPGPNGESNWHADHPDKDKTLPYEKCLAAFESLVTPLAVEGVSVVNCTRRTALTVFPQMALEDALAQVPA